MHRRFPPADPDRQRTKFRANVWTLPPDNRAAPSSRLNHAPPKNTFAILTKESHPADRLYLSQSAGRDQLIRSWPQ